MVAWSLVPALRIALEGFEAEREFRRGNVPVCEFSRSFEGRPRKVFI